MEKIKPERYKPRHLLAIVSIVAIFALGVSLYWNRAPQKDMGSRITIMGINADVVFYDLPGNGAKLSLQRNDIGTNIFLQCPDHVLSPFFIPNYIINTVVQDEIYSSSDRILRPNRNPGYLEVYLFDTDKICTLPDNISAFNWNNVKEEVFMKKSQGNYEGYGEYTP